jgi:membrane protein
MFPALIALVSIVGLVGNPASTAKTLTDIVTKLGPSSAAETFTGPIKSITAHKSAAGILLIVGILSALWSASSYVGAFMRASNVMYEVDEGRPIWKLRPLQMLVTLVMILLLVLAAVAVIVTGPLAKAIGSSIGVSSTAVTIWDIAKWPVVLVVVSIMISVLYYASPNAKLPGFKFVTPGGLIAVLIWVVASAAFAFYVANFGSYDKTYGTLGGVVVFLVWLWITNAAILFGAELNAERERARQIEAGTEGAERELQAPERDVAKDKQRPRTA